MSAAVGIIDASSLAVAPRGALDHHIGMRVRFGTTLNRRIQLPLTSTQDFSDEQPITLGMAPTLSLMSENRTLLTERRRRSRLVGETLGWLLPSRPQMAAHLPDEDEGWEVMVCNVSRLGAGFITTEPLRIGELHRLRIGRGPIKRARLMRVIVCRQCEDQTWAVGAEFADISERGLSRAG